MVIKSAHFCRHRNLKQVSMVLGMRCSLSAIDRIGEKNMLCRLPKGSYCSSVVKWEKINDKKRSRVCPKVIFTLVCSPGRAKFKMLLSVTQARKLKYNSYRYRWRFVLKSHRWAITPDTSLGLFTWVRFRKRVAHFIKYKNNYIF
jgi:hypothetical protein